MMCLVFGGVTVHGYYFVYEKVDIYVLPVTGIVNLDKNQIIHLEEENEKLRKKMSDFQRENIKVKEVSTVLLLLVYPSFFMAKICIYSSYNMAKYKPISVEILIY